MGKDLPGAFFAFAGGIAGRFHVLGPDPLLPFLGDRVGADVLPHRSMGR